MNDTKFTVDCIGETQYRVEKRGEDHDKIWSGGPEICIAHIFKGRRSQFGPSIPLDKIPELILYLVQAYGELKEDPTGQSESPVA